MYKQVKNQNYVPRFLLKKFSDTTDTQIWCYDKLRRKSAKRSIKTVSVENRYEGTNPAKKEERLEFLMSRLEMGGAPIIQKIIHTQRLNLTADEKASLCMFMALLLSRTKAAREQIDKVNKELTELMADYETVSQAGTGTQAAKNGWFSSFDSIPDFAVALSSKLWFLLKSDKQFLTSDNPIVKQNTLNRQPNQESLGLSSKGIEVYFPLSDSLLLCLLCENAYSILKGKELPIAPENIENINALQILYSERFVFSSGNNFDLAKDMAKKGEI